MGVKHSVFRAQNIAHVDPSKLGTYFILGLGSLISMVSKMHGDASIYFSGTMTSKTRNFY